MNNTTKTVMDELKNAGYDCAIAIATQAEINAKAACGMLASITEK